ncbi:hypothetical protein PMAYCL1PPCAC_30198, partial [Pristionchus mayeri]
GNDLEDAGLPGPSHIRSALGRTKKAHTLVNAVKKFQNDNVIKSSPIASALKMIDMIGVKRSDCYDQMISTVSEKVVGQLKEMGKGHDTKTEKILEKHLGKSFKTYRIPQFRPSVLETLAQIEELPQGYIDKIVSDPDLYADASIKVKRQIWIDHDKLFEDAVHPVIAAYIDAKRAVLCSIDPCPTNFFSSETTKSRRQFEHIQTLMNMFGKYAVLYDKTAELIKEAYRVTADPLYCSLKQEVIMAAHDTYRTACTSDPCHSLAWVLDVCLRDKHMEQAQIAKIKNIFENMKKMTIQKVGDLSMVTADPHVVHFLCNMAIKLLRDHKHIPREQGGFMLIVRLLTLSSYAHQIVCSETLPSQMVEVIFFTKFLPSFGSLIAEDLMRLLLSKHDRLDSAEAAELYSQPSEDVAVFLKCDLSAALLWIHYVADLLPRRNLELRGLFRFVRLLPILKDQIACHSPWSHLLMHRILTSCQVNTLVDHAEVLEVLIDRMFLPYLKMDIYLKYQLLRLVNQTHHNLKASYLQSIMENISPTAIGDCADSDRYTFEYDRVMEKMHPKTEELAMPPPMLLTQGSRKLMTSMTPMTPRRIEMTPSHNFDY